MARGYSGSKGRFSGRSYGGYGATVAVREGELTLDGSVPERCMRYLIEDLAAGHPAVRDVDNRIAVRKA